MRVMYMAKKYSIGFQVAPTGEREMVIESDDLDSLSQADWFRDFLDVRKAVPAPPQIVRVVDQESQARLLEANRRIEQLQNTLNQMQATQQPPRVQTPPQPLQQQQPPAQQPQAAPKRMPSSFLEIAPNMMDMAIWNSLSKEQQDEWKARYL